MDEVKRLVWNGELNVLVSIDPSFLMKGSPREITVLRIRVSRETYLINYMPFIWKKIKKFLSFDPLNDNEKYFWFEHNKVPLSWNYPVGVLFDGLVGKSGTFATSFEDRLKDVITILKIRLVMGDSLPPTIIPITTSETQVEKYWFHQWKQVCFILNGSSKDIMSLTVNESRKFWSSIITRNFQDFVEISSKISPSRPRHIPIIVQIFKSSGTFRISQPTIRMTGVNPRLKDVEEDIFNTKEGMNANNCTVICQGIEIPWEIVLCDMYYKLRSFDGLLYITLVSIKNSDKALSEL